ncbi:MAG: hypothetical protein SVQ76_01230 [Candidatus Nanohaloarchaea archaeon]|nr:hypothetical protein [Candidatus Nanohaloarchaea archaeon]
MVLIFGMVAIAIIITGMFQSYKGLGSGSKAKSSMDSFRKVVDNGCQLGVDAKDTSITFYDLQKVTMQGASTFEGTTPKGETVTVDSKECRTVIICQESTSKSGCSEGGKLPGGKEISVRINYLNDGKKAQIKLIGG